jgi:hypothetical protein
MAVAGMLTGPAAPRWSWLVLWAVSAWALAAAALPSFGPALQALPWPRADAAAR